MNKAIISREEIIFVGKACFSQVGTQALSIREIAHSCGIAVGSVYNYFPSKEDLIIAIVESIWLEIVHTPNGCSLKVEFAENVRLLYENIEKGLKKYPAFLNVHSTNFAHVDKAKGQAAMHRHFAHMQNGLLNALAKDTNVRENAFSDTFTASAFVDFVLTNILTLLTRTEVSCDCLLEIIRRILY